MKENYSLNLTSYPESLAECKHIYQTYDYSTSTYIDHEENVLLLDYLWKNGSRDSSGAILDNIIKFVFVKPLAEYDSIKLTIDNGNPPEKTVVELKDLAVNDEIACWYNYTYIRIKEVGENYISIYQDNSGPSNYIYGIVTNLDKNSTYVISTNDVELYDNSISDGSNIKGYKNYSASACKASTIDGWYNHENYANRGSCIIGSDNHNSSADTGSYIGGYSNYRSYATYGSRIAGAWTTTCTADSASVVEGRNVQASLVQNGSHLEGAYNHSNTVKNGSHADGYNSYGCYMDNAGRVDGYENYQCWSKIGSHVGGTWNRQSSADYGSEIIGRDNHNATANDGSHIDGAYNQNSLANNGSHIEGYNCYGASATYGSHIEGYYNANITITSGSHIEGMNNTTPVTGLSAIHVGGGHNAATNDFETVVGKYCNYSGISADNPLFVVGNGTSNSNRSDAFIITSAGYASATNLGTSGFSDVDAALSALSASVSGIETILQTI